MSPDDPVHDVGTLSLDACLELLSNRQRRVILEFFLDSETNHASVDELISEIINEEASRTGERPGHDAVASTMFHVHLPKFADANVLEYDTRHLEVRYRGDPLIEAAYAKIQEIE
ncbi:hypothetical protein SAMN05216559_4119 [Halomicrobium zhouii]|uniref:DUF7344 domain-containing protein n=1 Tax=Halomicrobium zhouii TaxID=767519 RepID=A0A1I6MAK4_9EURY|nr:hypothetical protein [Halomicrobium zhouii]SFS12754.1 hypothetical protein SAMN05216559_4119 [Halomicrobium zhouii]